MPDPNVQVNENPENLTGMNAREAREYIFGFITTLKLTEKEINSLESEAAKWKTRAELARSKGISDLLEEAEKESGRLEAKLVLLREEKAALEKQIENMRRQIPGLAARERSIDPDLLEQELLMALGSTEEEAAAERAFKKLEKENSANDELEKLKAKMKGHSN